MTSTELYQAGKLEAAVQAAVADVKANPTDTGLRYFLTELLCFNGEWERADKQLETLTHQALDAAVKVILLRHLVRAEIARQQFYTEGRLPEFLTEVSPSLRLRLDALIAINEGNAAEAAELLAKAEEQRPAMAGTCDGTSFDDFRDLDDLSAGYLDVLTSTGKYYIVPLESVESVTFKKPERPVDLLWRETEINVKNGPEGQVYVPAIYPQTTVDGDEQLRLGRGTDWVGEEHAPVRGRGLRSFLVGDQDRTIMQITSLQFEQG